MSVRAQPAVQRRPFLAPAVAHNIPRAEDQAAPSIGLQVLLFVLAAAYRPYARYGVYQVLVPR